jgi:hypothetical protein
MNYGHGLPWQDQMEKSCKISLTTFLFPSVIFLTSLHVEKKRDAKAKFMEAASFFLQMHNQLEKDKKFSGFAASLYLQCEEWVLAGDVFMQDNDFRQAGEAYMQGKKYLAAATAYMKASIKIKVTIICE